MLVCESPELVGWRPDFSSSEQADPDWTKLLCGGIALCNSLEGVQWLDERAVQVELCESCGQPGCASGGYVHISRLGAHLLWTPPEIDSNDAWESYQLRPTAVLREHGATAIPTAEWESWTSRFDGMPPAEWFPPTRRRDLRAAWDLESPIRGMWDDSADVLALAGERLVAAESETTDEAMRRLRAVAEWLTTDDDTPVEAQLSRAVEPRALYFDVPDTFDRPKLREWRPYVLDGDRLSPAFRGGWTLAPALI